MKIIPRKGLPAAQRGAALVYVAVMLLILSLGLVYIFNAFQLSNEKTRLQNTTDAAAYSVAVVEARHLNFMAYTNRAMVANQVAVAQYISFLSWTRWLEVTADNLATVTSWIPYVGEITAAIDEVVQEYSEVVEEAMDAAITATNEIIQLLSMSQKMMYAGTYVVASDTLNEVIKRNDPEVDTLPTRKLALISFEAEHVAFTSQFSPDYVRDNGPNDDSDEYAEQIQRSDEFRDITLRSRDNFSSGASRNYTWISVPGFPDQFKLVKGGGTELTASDTDDHDHSLYYTWTAIDTMSVHSRSWNYSKFKWRSWKEFFPTGWGGAQTGEDVTLKRHRGKSYWQRNPISSGLVEETDYDNSVGDFNGLTDFFDLQNRGLLDDGPGLMLLLVKANGDTAVRTSKNVGFNAGRIDLEKNAQMASNRMAALARAGTYFARPTDLWARDTGGREYGNLYNPYWQARLEETSLAERTAAAILAGLPGLPFGNGDEVADNGSGSGSDNGSGNGNEFGDGNGSDNGDGLGNDDGLGDGNGSGNGNGSGSGSGDGGGADNGNGNGNGTGDGGVADNGNGSGNDNGSGDDATDDETGSDGAGDTGDLCSASNGSGSNSNPLQSTNQAAAPTQSLVGNPIDSATGNKYQSETDYVGSGEFPLRWQRFYNSIYSDTQNSLGNGWRHSYSYALVITHQYHTIVAQRPDGGRHYFYSKTDGGPWLAGAGLAATLTAQYDSKEEKKKTVIGFDYLYGGWHEHYDAAGKLRSITNPLGQTQTLRYDDEDRLQSVRDAVGGELKLSYRFGLLRSIATPDGRELHYRYDDVNNLTDVQTARAGFWHRVAFWKKNPVTQYVYDDRQHPHALTAIVDATGQRAAHWTYDDLGRANMSEHGDGSQRIDLVYNNDGTVKLTNASGHTSVLHFVAQHGVRRLARIDGEATTGCGASTRELRYYDSGFLAAMIDGEGHATTFERDREGRVIKHHDGLQPVATMNATPLDDANIESAFTPTDGAIATTTRWHALLSQPLEQTVSRYRAGNAGNAGGWIPVRKQVQQFDDHNRLAARTDIDLQADTAPQTPARTTTWQYRYHDDRQTHLASILRNDPRPAQDGHDDITQLDFDIKGNLLRQTNALGQATQYSDFDASGQPGTVQLPNHQTLHVAYNAQGLAEKLQRSGGDKNNDMATETTVPKYDLAGKLTQLTRPDGSELTYRYDSAGQVTQINNGWGESVALKLNAQNGQWEEQTVRDASGKVVRQQHRRFNGNGQLASLIGNDGQLTELGYDSAGNLIRASEGGQGVSAESMHTTQARYDAQHRLRELIDAAGYSTHYAYGGSGEIEAVTDTGKNTTVYKRNGFGEIISEISPVGGEVLKRHDENGNLIANETTSGAAIRFDHDILNRLTVVDYPGEQSDVHYSYDQNDADHGNGIAQLTHIETSQQITDYRYDEFGRKVAATTREKNAEGQWGRDTTLQYHYLPGDRLESITYADGSEVRYHYDRDRVASVTYQEHEKPDAETTILRNIAYVPFGGAVGWTYGNGLTQQKVLDRDGRIAVIELRNAKGKTLWSQQYGYDVYQNIARIDSNGDVQQFGYDRLDRLMQENSNASATRYGYDALGNRTEVITNNQTQQYQYRDQLTLTQYGDKTVQMDAAGNRTHEQSADGTSERRYRYNARNKLSLVAGNRKVDAQYRYNAQGLRTEKRVYPYALNDNDGNLQRIRYAYSPSGQLLDETTWNTLSDADPTPQKQIHYLWLGSIPIAQIERSAQGTQLAYLHTDHLATPRMATNQDATTVWTWNSDAFGNGAANEDADGDGKLTQVRLRFPGQYADDETGLNYNVHRYYDPQTGRYTQADPLGQLASFNRYSYVDANPVSWLDPLGLARLQYVLIDSFGGHPTDAKATTLKDGLDSRMLHFAIYVTDIAQRPGAGFIYDPNGIYVYSNYTSGAATTSNTAGGVTWDAATLSQWNSFSSFYKNRAGANSFNTGDWAVVNTFDDTTAASMYDALRNNVTGPLQCVVQEPNPSDPFGNGGGGPFSPVPPTSTFNIYDYMANLPDLPQGFRDMDHFNFPTIVHKIPKPIFNVVDLPAANDAMFNTFPWHDGLTKNAEATNPEALHPHWPGGSSGITVGRGFDLGNFSNTQTVRNALARVGIVDPLVTNAAGLSGAAAQQYWNAHRDALNAFTLTTEQQYLLSLYAFEAKETNINNVATTAVVRLYNTFIKGATGPAWDNLDVKIRDVLFDLNYRGDFTHLSNNTQQNAHTDFDDVAFARSFRDAVTSNNVGDLCQVMNEFDVWTSADSWHVPNDRYNRRADHLKVNGQCPP